MKPKHLFFDFLREVRLSAEPTSQRKTSSSSLVLVLIAQWLCPNFARAALTDAIPGIGGDTRTFVPIGAVVDVPPMRMQQVYEARALENSMSEGGWITGVWFVTDENATQGWAASLGGFEMSLGLTGRNADNLSANFADNFSISPTIVIPKSPLTVDSGGASFAVKIDFLNPFLYHPSDGNLLLEVKNSGPLIGPFFVGGPLDAWNVTGDAVSRVYARGDANATVGTVDTIGLTTFFVFTPVPEPSTVTLLALGAGALGWHSWRRRQHR